MLTCKYDKPANRGQMAITAFVASAVLVVTVVAVVYYSQKESEKVETAGKTSVALKMAEQGLSRALWKVEERIQNWDTLMESGGTLAGYNYDVKYTEGDGEFCIQIASATPANTVSSEEDRDAKLVVTVIGRDKDQTDVKTLRVIYINEMAKPDYAVYILNEKKHKRKKRDKHDVEKNKSAWLGPFLNDTYAYVQSLPDKFVTNAWADDDDDDFDEDQMKGVHWGPIVSLGDMKLKKKNMWLNYPRKFASGNIKGRDDNGTNPPNTDGKEWWSYDELVPSPPNINFDFYRKAAKGNGIVDSVTYFSGGGIYHTKGNGSNCVPSHGEREGKNEDKNEKDDNDNHWLVDQQDTYGSPRCYFYEDVNCKITGNTYIEGVVIVLNKKLMVKEGRRHVSQGQYTATVPPKAWKEYKKIDTSASGEYPADIGLSSVAGTYAFDASNPVTIKGLIYATKEVQLKGGANVHGVVIVGKKFKFDGSGNAQVFYDHTLKIKSTELSLVLDKYNEIKAEWPSGL